MKNIARRGIPAVALSLALVAPSGAGPFENGLATYGRRDDATAIQLWWSLADQGKGLAQRNVGFMYVIGDDNGGELAVYYERYRTAVALGATFRIDGRCRSACTLVLAWADRVCITERAALGFHQVRDERGQRVQSESDRVMSLYPAPVREYILARGGLPPPWGTMWVSGPALRGLVKPCE